MLAEPQWHDSSISAITAHHDKCMGALNDNTIQLSAHRFEVLEEIGVQPVMDRNIPLAIISGITLTVPPVLHNIIIIEEIILTLVVYVIRGICMCLQNEILDLQSVSALK